MADATATMAAAPSPASSIWSASRTMGAAAAAAAAAGTSVATATAPAIPAATSAPTMDTTGATSVGPATAAATAAAGATVGFFELSRHTKSPTASKVPVCNDFTITVTFCASYVLTIRPSASFRLLNYGIVGRGIDPGRPEMNRPARRGKHFEKGVENG